MRCIMLSGIDWSENAVGRAVFADKVAGDEKFA